MCWVTAVIKSKRYPFDGEYFCEWGEAPSERVCAWFHASKVADEVSPPRALTEAAHAVVRERNEAVKRAEEAERKHGRTVKQLNEMVALRDRAAQERDIAQAALPPLETSLKLHEATVAAQAGQLEDAKVENQRVWDEVKKLQAKLDYRLACSQGRPLHVTDVTITQDRVPLGEWNSWMRFRGRCAALPGGLLKLVKGDESAEFYVRFDDHLINILRQALGCVAEPAPSDPSAMDGDRTQIENYLADSRSGSATHVPVSRACLRRWSRTIERLLGELQTKESARAGEQRMAEDYSNKIGGARAVLGASPSEDLSDVVSRVNAERFNACELDRNVRTALGARTMETTLAAAQRVFAEASALRGASEELDEAAEKFAKAVAECKAVLK